MNTPNLNSSCYRDGRESDVVTKTYVVDDIEKINSSPLTIQSETSDLDTSDFFDSDGWDLTDSTLRSSKSSKSSKGKLKKVISLNTLDCF